MDGNRKRAWRCLGSSGRRLLSLPMGLRSCFLWGKGRESILVMVGRDRYCGRSVSFMFFSVRFSSRGREKRAWGDVNSGAWLETY